MSDENPPSQEDMRAVRAELRELSAQVRGLVDAWQTAQGLVKFMKLLGSMATGATALWLFVKLVADMRKG